MTKREKTIKGIEHCKTELDCVGCVYSEQMKAGLHINNKCTCMEDVLELLKEQEPVKPKQRNPHLGAWWYECGNCDTAISPSDNYCRGCGRVIDWS